MKHLHRRSQFAGSVARRTRIRLSSALFILAAVAAFAHGDERLRVPLPDEDVLATGIVPDPAQAFGKASTPVRAFLARHPDWQMRLDDRTGVPHRAWGDGIPIDGFPAIFLLNAERAGRAFLDAHQDLLGSRNADLRALGIDIVHGTAYVKFAQYHHGVRVLHASVDLRISHDGRIFLFGSEVQQDIAVETAPAFSIAAAKRFATAGISGRVGDQDIEGGTLSILPLRFPDRTDFHLVFQFRVPTTDDLWDTYVDAHDGTILWRRSLIDDFAGTPGGAPSRANTLTGRVTASVFPVSYLLGADTIPVPNLPVTVGGNTYVTDADGRFTAAFPGDSARVIARLAGPYATARRADTSAGIHNAQISVMVAAGSDIVIRFDDANSHPAERTVFHHLNVVHSFLRTLDASERLAALDAQIPGIVNVNAECNASWNGKSVNFFHESEKCANTGEIADVIYHEYGHAVNQYLYTAIGGTRMRNSALNEGTADILANMLRDDPRIGIGFMKGQGDGTIRNSDNMLHYPENIVNESHADGSILAGAVWDMRKAVGIDRARYLTHFCKYGTPDGKNAGEAFSDYFLEILVADDDDGNLANGTPNASAIIPAFVKHGIVSAAIAIDHAPLHDQQDPAEIQQVDGHAQMVLPQLRGLFSIASAHVVYSIDGWSSILSAPLAYDSASSRFTGPFPLVPSGSIVRYYIEATDNFGSKSRLPQSAPRSFFTFLVGFRSRILNTCEIADGWTVKSTAKTGAWVRDTPIGTWNTDLGKPPTVPWVQPDTDHTPGTGNNACWVTGNAPAGLSDDENDVDAGTTTLTTSALHTRGMHDPLLRYYCWYSNDAGSNPNSDPFLTRISSDGGATWKTLDYTMKSDAQWTMKLFHLRDIVSLTDSIVLAFSVTDLAPESIVEAALDDIEILDTDAMSGIAPPFAAQEDIRLDPGYPNPCAGATTITFHLSSPMHVRVSICDVLGRVVTTLVDGNLEPGGHSAVWSPAGQPSGIYEWLFEAEGRRIIQHVLYMR